MLDIIGVVTNVGCMMVTLAVGVVILSVGWTEKESQGVALGLALIAVGFIAVVENPYGKNQYIPAEPIAYNSNQTVFNTEKGNFIANGIYPDGEYMLNVEDNEVFVVWQAVEGGVGLG